MDAVRFDELNINDKILKAVKEMGFEAASPIQGAAIPVVLEGRDIVGQAQTGTGKTAAFGIPLLEKMDTKVKRPQAMILCPTRELAIQVADEIRKLAKFMHGAKVLPIYGGQNITNQIRSLKTGANIIVGTPGRIMDHMRRHTLKLEDLKMVVLDEADEMLNMGFREDIESILKEVPEERQTLLFSATMPKAILDITKKYQKDSKLIKVVRKELTVPNIEQYYYEVRPKQKVEVLCRLLDMHSPKLSIVFCNTKRMVDEVTGELKGRGYFAEGIHGDLKQSQRDRVMKSFRGGRVDILVATDVAARGIDVDDVDAVFNYDLPQDDEFYVHRIGRTGSAGREGKAFTFVTVREQYKIREIIRYTKARIQPGQLPTLRDVSNIRTSKLLDEVRQTLAESSLDRWRVLVEDFQTEHFPDGDASSRDISAALFKLLMQRDFGNQDNVGEVDELTMAPQRPAKNAEAKSKGRMQPLPRRQESGPMSRLHIDVGQAHDVTPRALVGAITGESGIPGRSVGAIDIQNNFSIVEISAELAAHVLATLNKGVFISGVKVSAKAADETDSPHPRKPFAPGQRRQRPGKFGKKPRGATLGRKAYSESR